MFGPDYRLIRRLLFVTRSAGRTRRILACVIHRIKDGKPGTVRITGEYSNCFIT